MNALKSITLEQFSDATAIFCNIALGSAALVALALLLADVVGGLSDSSAYRQIAVDCVRSL